MYAGIPTSAVPLLAIILPIAVIMTILIGIAFVVSVACCFRYCCSGQKGSYYTDLGEPYE